MQAKILRCIGSFSVAVLFATSHVAAQGQDSTATVLLQERNQEFREEVLEVADGVYVALGFGVSPSSMIVGSDGIIIVDTMIDTTSAARAFAEFREITDKPVKGIIFTHGHGDHVGGAAVFAEGVTPEVWAHANFGAEENAFASAGLTIQQQRGARQGGFLLPPEKRINNGVARAYYPQRGAESFGSAGGEQVVPTHSVSEPRVRIEIADVEIELVAVSGETDDGLYIWLPEQQVVFSGDNFYKSWPNAYAIRGTPYRDVKGWAGAIDSMLSEGAVALVPGHTRPILGESDVREVLTDYRDAIRFVFDKTIEGMNQGMTPDELVDYVKLPPELAEKDYLREYYGNVEWAVRAIFDGYLGWYDGNPTNLFPLSPGDEAQRIVQLAGGVDAILEQARTALGDGDAQWAAQLSDYLIALQPESVEPKLLKAEALEVLAEALLTATGRNYYLTVAQQLRAEAGSTTR